MSYRRRRNFRSLMSPAQKNVYQRFGNTVTLNVTASQDQLALATNAPDGIQQVSYPCRIKMVYLDYTMVFESSPAFIPEVVVLMRKNPGDNLVAPTVTNCLSLGNYTGVSQVFKVWQGSPGYYGSDNNSFRIRGWIPLPKRHQVFNESDELELFTASNSAITATICVLCIYKWRQ